MYIDVTKAKFQELIDAVKAKNEESDNKLVWCLALIGGAVIAALIAYCVYRFLTPDYYDDYDDDFDDFDDDFEDEEVEVAGEDAAADDSADDSADEPDEEPAEEEKAEEEAGQAEA